MKKTRDHRAEYARAKYLRDHPEERRRKGSADVAPARESGEPIPNIVDEMTPVAIRIGVADDPSPAAIAAPEHPAASGVPEAGAESGQPATTGGADSAPTAETSAPAPEAPLALDPKTVTQLLKGAFGIVALITKEDHWKAEESEVEGVAEPMCRQLSRIPIVAAMGQNTADLVIIGSTLGTLIYLRIEESQRLLKLRKERLREMPRVATRSGETVETMRHGDLRQEVREPNEPGIDLTAFRGAAG